jgi:hypothetical protein
MGMSTNACSLEPGSPFVLRAIGSQHRVTTSQLHCVGTPLHTDPFAPSRPSYKPCFALEDISTISQRVEQRDLFKSEVDGLLIASDAS